MSTKREIPNVSYTNKDFNSIYVELLEYSKKLSHRWDPTISDESDPGVVLLKLAALIGDKNNYNIDKSVLELMPNSVTQLSCARQLFSQCGYTMAYYNSGVGQINFTLNNVVAPESEEEKGEDYTYTLPRFTMLTDVGNSVVYTTINELSFEFKTETAIDVIEGAVSDYKINGDSLITTANLDSNNRLYFLEQDIAENGIFITNVDSTKSNFTNYDEWYKVDILETEPPLSTCYRFGLSLDGSLCYIQFPEDVDLLFGEGINIKYIRTKGSSGNITANFIRQFYVDTEIIKKNKYGEETRAAVTVKDVHITNPLPILNGCDPETIDEAYRSYRRVKNTFDTLVSLKDYNDYLVTSKSASNGFVCDRTNDIQRSYRIQEKTSAGLQDKIMVENKIVTHKWTDDNNEEQEYKQKTPTMLPYDLCVYSFNYIPQCTNYTTLKESFKLDLSATYEKKLAQGNQKSLQHDFLGFEKDKILLIKNKYPIKCTVVPRYELTLNDAYEIQANIESAISNALNSNELDFSEPIKFDLLRNTILNADSRIKHIEGLETPKYSTWAVFLHGETIQEMRVDIDSFSGGFQQVPSSNSALDLKNLYYYDEKTDSILSAEGTSYNSDTVYYSYDKDLNDLWMRFRCEIYAKNILCGTTPLYVSASIFKYGFNQANTKQMLSVSKVTTNTNISFEKKGNELVSNVLDKNENILLTAPNFVQENSFSSYVKIIYSLAADNSDTGVISPDSKYFLKKDEFIIFLWKSSDSDSAYSYIKYDSSTNSPTNVISPSFELPKVQNSTLVNKIRKGSSIEYFSALPAGKGKLDSNVGIEIDGTKITPNEFVKRLTHNDQNEVLIGSQVITTFGINEIHINNTVNGSSSIYWILNDTIIKDGKEYYRLFDENETRYTLGSGEYFIYTNTSRSVLHVLGEGTRIERKGWSEAWDANVITYAELILKGADLLTSNNCWYNIKKSDTDNTLYATEMQRYQLGPGNKLHLIPKPSSTIDETFFLDNTFKSLQSYIIEYSDETEKLITIPQIEGTKYFWEACSILNLNLSSDTPQKLQSNQDIIFSNDNSIRKEMTSEKELAEGKITEKVISVLCSNPIHKVGGTNISTLYFNNPSDFMYYTQPKNENEGHLTYDDEELSLIVRTHDSMEYSLGIPTFKCLQGSYIIQIDPLTDVTSLNLGIQQGEESDNYKLEPFIASGNIQTLYKLHVETDSDINLYVYVESEKGMSEIKFNPMFKYSTQILNSIPLYPVDLVDEDNNKVTFEQQLITKLNELDPTTIYDYTNTNTYIDNPLVSNSFLNQKHFYNPYTICEWTVDKSIEKDIVVYRETR